MRSSRYQAWLIFALILGGAAPSPRMASYLLAAAPDRTTPDAPRKEPSCRARNRVTTPVPVARTQSVVVRVARAEVPPPAPASWPLIVDRGRPPLLPPHRLVPIPFRLRC